MSIEEQICAKIKQVFQPQVLDIINESHMHSGPATDSHFKLLIVSDVFEGLRPVARHQKVYGVLADELAGEVHALALHTHSPAEWVASAVVPASPDCRGGSKAG